MSSTINRTSELASVNQSTTSVNTTSSLQRSGLNMSVGDTKSIVLALQALQEKIRKLEQDRNFHQDQYDKAQRAHEQYKLDMERQMEQERTQHRQRERELQDLLTRANDERTRLQGTLDDSRHGLGTLKSELEEIQATERKIGEQREEQLKREAENLRKQLAEERQRYQKASVSLEQLTSEREALVTANSQLEDMIGEISERLHSSTVTAQMLQQQQQQQQQQQSQRLQTTNPHQADTGRYASGSGQGQSPQQFSRLQQRTASAGRGRVRDVSSSGARERRAGSATGQNSRLRGGRASDPRQVESHECPTCQRLADPQPIHNKSAMYNGGIHSESRFPFRSARRPQQQGTYQSPTYSSLLRDVRTTNHINGDGGNGASSRYDEQERFSRGYSSANGSSRPPQSPPFQHDNNNNNNGNNENARYTNTVEDVLRQLHEELEELNTEYKRLLEDAVSRQNVVGPEVVAESVAALAKEIGVKRQQIALVKAARRELEAETHASTNAAGSSYAKGNSDKATQKNLIVNELKSLLLRVGTA